MTLTIPLDRLLLFGALLFVYLLSCALERCERYRALTDWIVKRLGDD